MNDTDRTISLSTHLAPSDIRASELAAAAILQRKGRVLDAMSDSLAALRQRSGAEERKLLDELNQTSTNLAAMVLGSLAVLGCKSAAEKQRDRQLKEQRQQQAQQKQKTSDLVNSLEAMADNWAKLAPPAKLTKEPYVKGKLVVVYRRADDINEVHENDVIGLGELHAETTAEVQTVVQTDCFQVRRGSYLTKDQEKKEIPAFVSECEVVLIDLSQPAIIYRKKFENTKLLDEINSTNVNWETIKRKNKVAAPEPQGEIRDFLLGLPRK